MPSPLDSMNVHAVTSHKLHPKNKKMESPNLDVGLGSIFTALEFF